MYDEDYECPNIRELLWQYTIGRLKWRLYHLGWRYRRWVCNRSGHVFHDKREFRVEKLERSFVEQHCQRCRQIQLLDAETREEVTEKIQSIYGLLIWERLERQHRFYKHLPHEVWKRPTRGEQQ